MTTDNVERIDPSRARADVNLSRALLVCAYESSEKCRDNHIDGAMNLQDLQAREAQLTLDQEIIFYCA